MNKKTKTWLAITIILVVVAIEIIGFYYLVKALNSLKLPTIEETYVKYSKNRKQQPETEEETKATKEILEEENERLKEILNGEH